MVVVVSSIIFAGVGSMFASAFRSQIHSTRQQILQGVANAVIKRMQRDLYQATYLNEPTATSISGTNPVMLDGYLNGYKLNGTWRTVAGGSAQRFLYRVCDTDQLQYFRYAASGTESQLACGASVSGSDVYSLLVGPPIKIRNFTATGRPTGPGLGASDFNRVRVSFELAFPASTAHGELVMMVDTELTGQLSRQQPW